MEWTVIINEVFTVVLIPLLGLITKYVIEFLHTKKEEAKKEEQSKADTKKARRGIKICVF